jgi:TPR repeat protein
MDARLEKAAHEGDAEAQFEAGNFFTSKSVSSQKESGDNRRAFAWYRKAAMQGHANAQYRLALAYADGVGVRADSIQAADSFKKAAEQGNPWAQFRLGQCYKNGDGVAANLETAISWFQKAADQEHEKARALLESTRCALVQNKTLTVSESPPENNHTPFTLPAENVLAWKKLFEKKYGAEDLPANQASKSGIISETTNTPKPASVEVATKSVVSAIKEPVQGHLIPYLPIPDLRALAETENLNAQHWLAIRCLAYGPDRNVELGMKWLRTSAERGDARSLCLLGQRYESGFDGLAKEFGEAFKCFWLAAAQENAAAYFNLGRLYAFGRGVNQDYIEAIKWNDMAAAKGHREALEVQPKLLKCISHGSMTKSELGNSNEMNARLPIVQPVMPKAAVRTPTASRSKLSDVLSKIGELIGAVLKFIVALILFILFLLVFNGLFGSCPMIHPSLGPG